MSYTVGSTRVINTTSASGTTDFTFTFPYIKEAHIEVYKDYTKLNQGTGATEYQVITNVSPKLIRLGTATASANVRLEIRRNSSLDTPLVDYADGSTLTANDLDTSALQSLYIDQELKDSQFQTVTISESTGLPSLGNKRLTEVSDPTAAQDAATKNYVDTNIDTKIDSALTDDIAAGSSISIADNSPSSGKVTINVIAATGSNSGSLSASDKTKLDGIDTGAKDDQTAAEIRALVESATDSNVFTDADHSKLNAIEASATADQTNAEIRAAVEAATDSNVFTDADHTKLNAIEANATIDQTASEIKTLLQSDKLTDSEITAGTLDNRYYTETELDAGQLDNRYYTETESDARYFNISTGDTIKDGDAFPDNDTTIATTAAINDRIIDLVDDVGGFVPIANETSFPNANPDVNNGSGTLVSIKALGSNLTSNGSGVATISNGTVGNSTVTITGLANSTTYAATFGMIVETTSTLNTYTFHRLVPKATEVTTVAGSISNINTVATANTNINTLAGINADVSTVAGIHANVTTVAGISSNVTSVAGNSTNINAVNSNATNINTVAGAATNINTTAGSIANVNTVATNISSVNDFAARYRVASSAPSSSLDTGDLYFDTSGNELKVYNGSAWQGGVTATGDLLSKSGDQMTGNLTFSGSQTVDGRDLSVDGAKLDNIAANANNYTHPNHTGEVTSSADGATVVTDNTIDEANLKVSNSPTNGQFLSAQSGNTGGLTWATPTDTTYSVGDGGLTQNNFTDTLKNKLDGIAASATNVTNNNQLTNGAGYITATLTEEQVEDYVGGMVTGNTETGITVTYQDADGTLDFVVASQTDNNFTTTLKNKLDGIATSANNYSISSDLLDEDDLSTDSATKVPSQQSVKAFSSNASNLTSGTVAAGRVATLNQNTTGSSGSCTGNAATATTAAGLTGSPNITVGTIGCGNITSTGSVTDSTGELRTIVQNTQAGAYTLVAADAGKHILASGNITVPDSVFSAGQAITIVNNTAGNLTITKGTNMYNTADGTNANRTLATRGMATLLFTAADTAYISGAGLS